MKNKTVTAVMLLVCLLTLAACGGEIKPNGKTEYNHVYLAHDEDDMYAATGWADNVFIGKVIKKISNNPNDGSPRTVYKVEVIENLKGELIKDIKLTYSGGYIKDGTLILNQGELLQDDGLPEIDETYIFSTFSQSKDGSLLVAALTGKKLYTEEAKSEFQDYINNQTEVNRQRFESIYDKK